MANIEINGISIQARDGSMVIEAADEAGIAIPRFCYHKKLSIAANCRMCLVEVEKMGKPMPACATPVNDGMVVHTRSPKALSAQRAVMEFLLINHPLDCPICDQGGECDLQEMALGYGNDVSQYAEEKRVVADRPIGPLIATEMTRCIHCTRCVRFGQEIAGVMELGATGRGEHTRIGTYIENSVDSELSGNVIDLCPVGALTSRPFRYSARSWELDSADSVSPHDAVGANLTVQSRKGKLQRVLPRDNESVNDCWLADRDRFAYLGLEHAERLTTPKIKRDGEWQDVDWDTALTFAAEGIKRAVDSKGGEQVGALAGYSATTEEHYLLQKLMRGIGSNNIDYRLQQLDFSDQQRLPAYPGLTLPIAEIDNIDAALLIGANVRKEQPLFGLRLRQAALSGAQISSVDSTGQAANFTLANRITVSPDRLVNELAAIAKRLVEKTSESAPVGFAEIATDATANEQANAIAESLLAAQNGVVWIGATANGSPQAATIRSLAALIAKLSGSALQLPGEGGNSAGAALAGALPHRTAGGNTAESCGRDWRGMLADGLDACVLLNVEPELDCADSAAALGALSNCGFVVSLSGYASDAALDYCDVLLPMAMYTETSGTFVNAAGNWQSFAASVNTPGDARPAWKLLRVLGNLLDVDGFEFFSSEEVRDEVRLACAGVAGLDNLLDWSAPQTTESVAGLCVVTDFAIYGTDPVVRRSGALQLSADGTAANALHMSGATASQAGVAAGQSVQPRCGGATGPSMTVAIDDGVAEGCVYLKRGTRASQGCGAGFGSVELIPA